MYDFPLIKVYFWKFLFLFNLNTLSFGEFNATVPEVLHKTNTWFWFLTPLCMTASVILWIIWDWEGYHTKPYTFPVNKISRGVPECVHAYWVLLRKRSPFSKCCCRGFIVLWKFEFYYHQSRKWWSQQYCVIYLVVYWSLHFHKIDHRLEYGSLCSTLAMQFPVGLSCSGLFFTIM
jgi:hypothetical protein